MQTAEDMSKPKDESAQQSFMGMDAAVSSKNHPSVCATQEAAGKKNIWQVKSLKQAKEPVSNTPSVFKDSDGVKPGTVSEDGRQEKPLEKLKVMNRLNRLRWKKSN